MSLLSNAKARFEYDVKEKYVAGVVLTGQEVKSVRGKHGSLSGSFVRILGNEAWLVNAQIPLYAYATDEDYDPKRMRKLLLHKGELLNLQQLSQHKGLTLVPLSLFLEGNRIKLEFGVGKGRKAHDKRAVIKKREMDREMAAVLKRQR